MRAVEPRPPLDLVALVRPDLERHRPAAVEALRRTYAAHPGATAFEVTHLHELDHAVLVRPVVGDDLGAGVVLLPGWADRIGTDAPDALPGRFRSDGDVRDAIGDWVVEVFDAAGGREVGVPTWLREEGDSDRYDLGADAWL
ncbi:hypothetical protein NOZE110980_05715 [Nocardioides zeicaulis]